MTVASEVNFSGPYNGNGVTTAFDYEFRIIEAAHLKVIKRTILGVDVELSDADYTVTGVGDSGGGQAIVAVAPIVGETISIVRGVPFTQETDLENQGAYFAETIEEALDLSAMRDQQLAEEVGRAITLPVGSEGLEVIPAALKYWRWNAAGTGIDFVSVVAVGNLAVSAYVETLLDDQNASAFLGTLGFSAFSKPLIVNADATSWRNSLSVYSKAEIDAIKAELIAAKTDVRRAIPTVFAPLTTFGLNSLHDCVAPGQAVVNADIEAVWDEKYGSALSGTVSIFVDWASGNDTTGTGSFHLPYKTVKKAMADAGGTRAIYMLGVYSEETINWTAADGAIAGGTAARAIKIIASTPGFIFRSPSVGASSVTWTASGSGYLGPITLPLDAAFFVKDGVRFIIPYFATQTEVDTNLYGWTNAAGPNIYMRLGTTNINTEKSNIELIFSGSVARISGALLYIRNITFRGITDFQMKYGQAGAVWNRPIVFMDNCKITYSNGSYNAARLGYGIKNFGGIFVKKNCEFLYNALDGENADPDIDGGTAQEPWGLSINCRYVGNGLQGGLAFVEFITANPGARNIQGSSYHQGLTVRINDFFEDNYGQNIADTQTTVTGGTWLVGCKAGSPRADMQAAMGVGASIIPRTNAINSRFTNLELQSANSYVDTCAAGGRDCTYGLSVPNGAKVFNSKFDGFTGATSGTITEYSPAAP